ncbi:uncharacterized protein LOC131931833 [Physella acuta]|uniref:uncharacterized protein LOC131931833 n=1 Tax=Physella acuta TaxID=109671 RepID=UPI0027DD5D22|nr:uncharacterized protein LOC131931833 [Physella acuta]
MTFVLNRSQQTKYKLLAQQAEGALDIFCRQLETEGHKRLQTLRDHALHHQALMELSNRAGNQAPKDNILARQELHALIQEKLKESTPSAKRRKRCQHILQKRRPLKIFDRTQTTSALLRMKDAISTRPASDRLKVTPKMVLPPIAVRWRPQSTEQPGESGFKSQSGNVFITSIGPNV